MSRIGGVFVWWWINFKEFHPLIIKIWALELINAYVRLNQLYLIEAEWHIFFSVNMIYTIIGSDNGLSPVRQQAII